MFLQTSDGLIFVKDTFPAIKPATTLEEIEKYIERRLNNNFVFITGPPVKTGGYCFEFLNEFSSCYLSGETIHVSSVKKDILKGISLKSLLCLIN